MTTFSWADTFEPSIFPQLGNLFFHGSLRDTNLSAISRADRAGSVLTKDKLFSELFSELSSGAGTSFQVELAAAVLTERHLRLQFAQGHSANFDGLVYQCSMDNGLAPSFAAARESFNSTVLDSLNISILQTRERNLLS
jgi:hypothetical protein